MGILKNANVSIWCGLHADHLIGRSSRCDLQIDETYVSGQHAAIRWTGGAWELKDLGSRNGTLVDGSPVEPGRPCQLQRGAAISFGRAIQTWTLEDNAEPRVMALSLDDGTSIHPDGDILCVPSTEAPEAVIMRSVDGSWQLERPDGVLTRIDHDEAFDVACRRWLFHCPQTERLTSVIERRPSLHNVRLHFSVSSDEEHVNLRIEWLATRFDLGSRTHNYILLTLARHRLADIAAGIAPSACGWVYQDELVRQLATSPAQLNVDIFRIRKHFGAFDLDDTVAIIERRPRSKQLRIGVANLIVERM